MSMLGTAVKNADVSSAALRRRLAGLALGVLAVGVTFGGQASAQALPQSHARPHAVDNQPGVNAKHAKPAPTAAAPRLTPPAPVHAQAPMRVHGPGRDHAPQRYGAPERRTTRLSGT